MKVRKLVLGAVMVAAGIAAQAGEITLYQKPHFRGAQITLNDGQQNVWEHGFNDQTSSLVIHSGRWQVCTDAHFTGHCAELSAGQYATLDPALNNRISSVRQLSADDRSHRRRRGDLQFFDQPGFRGAALELHRDADNFVQRGFNDRASSMIIRRGTWELCSDIHYGGRCRVFGPGQYESLGRGLSERVSSARLIDSGDHRRYRDDRIDDHRQYGTPVPDYRQPPYPGSPGHPGQPGEPVGQPYYR
jgi:hypothetical protein